MIRIGLSTLWVSKVSLSALETIFGLVLKENDTVVKSMRNLDVKENQIILRSTMFTMAKYIVPLE